MKLCPNCEGINFDVTIETMRATTGPGHGQLSMNDVKAVVVIGCVDCSETIEVLEADDDRIIIDVKLPTV
jgi:hypothetical protein